MARRSASGSLASLTRIARKYEAGLAPRKLQLLAALARSSLPSARQVLRLHELLCFLDAYPDDRTVRDIARRMLIRFRGRRDLRRHRVALAGTGIAGTDTPYRFFWPTARWIAEQWPGALVLDRGDAEHARAILDALPLLLEPVQAGFLRARSASSLDILDLLRPHGATDAEYFIDLVAAMPGDDVTREAFFDRVDPPLMLRAGKRTPERTTQRLDWLPPHFRQDPPKGARPELSQEIRRPPRRVVRLTRASTDALIQLARGSMITRERDLEVFQYARRDSAFLVDDGQGLGFALLGVAPERRALLPALFGGLILQNGVSTGYVGVDVLGRHAEVSFNVFETFRGGGASRMFARLLAVVHHVFECESFSIEPYQLGHENDEGIESGAWWFYHRLGFRPRAADTSRVAAHELRKVARNPAYRSPPRTLRRLATTHLFYSLVRTRRARLPRTRTWLAAATRELRRFPQASVEGRRDAATKAAMKRLGLREPLPASARRSLRNWAGLVLALTARERWTARERRELARVIAAKTGRDERTYLRRFRAHSRLRKLLDC